MPEPRQRPGKPRFRRPVKGKARAKAEAEKARAKAEAEKARAEARKAQTEANDFVCVEVLQPSQPNEVMSSMVSLPNHTFTGQA